MLPVSAACIGSPKGWHYVNLYMLSLFIFGGYSCLRWQTKKAVIRDPMLVWLSLGVPLGLTAGSDRYSGICGSIQMAPERKVYYSYYRWPGARPADGFAVRRMDGIHIRLANTGCFFFQ